MTYVQKQNYMDMKNIYLLLILFFFPNLIFAQEMWQKSNNPVVKRSAVYPKWDALATSDATVLMVNDTLKMWYVGSGWDKPPHDCPHIRIGYAWSLDGLKWNPHSLNPVLVPSEDSTQFDADGVETPCVIYDIQAPKNERYKMWYAGRNAKCKPINDHKIGYATSPDGINWTKYSTFLIEAGPAESWFNGFVSNPEVKKVNNTYKMWFTAPDLVLNGQETDGHGNIGYAVSNDGLNWTIHPTPVLKAGEQNNWDKASIAEPCIVIVDNRYYMFYSALDQWDQENFQVGFAHSTDGINWTKSISNPVLRIGFDGKFDSYWASHPGVIYNNKTKRFEMWYTGRDRENITNLTDHTWDIGFAYTTDNFLELAESEQNTGYTLKNKQLIFQEIDENYHVNIFTIDGINTISTTDKNIDLTALKSGIYIVNYTHNQHVFSFKLGLTD